MMKSFSLVLAASLCALTALAAPLAPEPVYPEIARRVVRQLNTTHLSGERFGDHLSAVAWTNLVDALDFDRTLLTQADLKRLDPLRARDVFIFKVSFPSGWAETLRPSFSAASRITSSSI